MDWIEMIEDLCLMAKENAKVIHEANNIRLNWCIAVRSHINKISCGCHRPLEMWVSDWKRYSDFVSKLKR